MTTRLRTPGAASAPTASTTPVAETARRRGPGASHEPGEDFDLRLRVPGFGRTAVHVRAMNLRSPTSYEPADFFAFRTPLLPFDDWLTWSEGLRASAALSE